MNKNFHLFLVEVETNYLIDINSIQGQINIIFLKGPSCPYPPVYIYIAEEEIGQEESIYSVGQYVHPSGT